MPDRVAQNPDLLADHRQFFIGDMPDDRRDAAAARRGITRAELDAILAKMATAWDALDQAPD